MKTKNIYQGIALLAMALTTAACQNELNEDTTQPQPGEKVNMTIRATQGTTPQTRTSYEDNLGDTPFDGILVKWEGGSGTNAPVEKIKVFGYTEGGEKFSESGTLESDPKTINNNGLSITFTGKVEPTNNCLAVYPAENSKYDKEGTINFDFLGQSQNCATGKELEHLKKYDIMIGTPTATDKTNFTFEHKAIMLRFDLTLPNAELVTNVTLATSVENGIFTKALVDLNNPKFPLQGYGDAQEISLGITSPASATALKAYMMIPNITLSQDAILTITVATNSGNNYEGKLKIDADTDLESGKCYTLTPDKLTLTNQITIPPITEGKLGDALKDFAPNAKQTELVLTGAVGDNDITALASFLKDSKSENITTLDLSGLTNTEVKGLGACTKVTTVILPASAESIADEAFLDCTSLTNIRQDEQASTTRASVSSKMKTVGARAFKGCTSMAEMFLHANITTIGANAFEGCTALTALVFEGTKTVGTESEDIKIGADVVKGTHTDLKILLPAITDATAAATYKKALGKPTSYNFAEYGKATSIEKVDPTKYKATVSDGSSVGDFTPGGTLGQ